MIRLVQHALRGPFAAASVSTGLLFLGLLLPMLAGVVGVMVMLPVLWSSSAVVAFVLLRRGPGQAVYAVVAAVALMLILSVLSRSGLGQLLAVVLQFWLPALVVAYVLRRSVDLGVAVLAGGLLGIVTLVFLHVVIGDTTAFWERVLGAQLDASLESLQQAATDAGSQIQQQQQIDALRASIGVMAKLATPTTAVMMMMTGISSVFLARSWQARLFNPGGFQQEFHQLRYGKSIAVAVLVLTAVSMVSGVALLTHMVIVLMAVMMIQGLAVLHSLVKTRGMSSGWLVGTYLLLLLPHTSALIGALGIADNWLNIRNLPPGDRGNAPGMKQASAGQNERAANSGLGSSDSSESSRGDVEDAADTADAEKQGQASGSEKFDDDRPEGDR